jgi:predicted outer membrane repeat protein
MADERSSKKNPQTKKLRRVRSRSPQKSPTPEQEDHKGPDDEEVSVAYYTPQREAVVSVFAPRGQLRTFLSVPQTILSHCPFFFVGANTMAHNVAPTDEDIQMLGLTPPTTQRKGISFKVTDASLATMAFGFLECHVVISPDATENDLCATVDIARFAKYVSAHDVDATIEVYRKAREPKLFVGNSSSTSGGAVHTPILDLGDPSKTSFNLKKMVMKYRVEIKTAYLQNVTKLATVSESNWLRIDVWEKPRTGERYLLFKMKGETGDGAERYYKSLAHKPGGDDPSGAHPTVTCFSIMDEVVGPYSRQKEDLSPYVQKYCDLFDVKHVKAFVDGAASATTIILIPESEGMPIVFTSTLGDNIGGAVGPSFVSQVQAPQIKEPDEDRSSDDFGQPKEIFA